MIDRYVSRTALAEPQLRARADRVGLREVAGFSPLERFHLGAQGAFSPTRRADDATHMWVALLLITAVLFVCFVAPRLGRGSRPLPQPRGPAGAFGTGRRPEEVTPSDGVVARMKAHDPEFDGDRFIDRVRRAWALLHDARSGDLDAIRPWVSDGVHERLALMLEDERRRGPRERRGEGRVRAVQLASLEVGVVFDQITVGVEAEVDWCRVG